MRQPEGNKPLSDPVFLREDELAGRWRITVRTLQRWRGAGTGPPFLRIGSRIAYRISDVQEFEATCTCVRGGRS